MPDPAVRPYLADATLYAEIALRAKRRYRIDGGDFDPSAYGAKVRQLIDDHLLSLGIEQKLPPVSLTAEDFSEKVAELSGARARASEMEHAVRDHIQLNQGRDPRYYRLLSERLEEILRDYADNWEQQAVLLAALVAELRDDQAAPDSPYSKVEIALYGVLIDEIARDGVTEPAMDMALWNIATEVYALAVVETSRRDFWRGPVGQQNLRSKIGQKLVAHDIVDIGKVKSLADQLADVIASGEGISRP